MTQLTGEPLVDVTRGEIVESIHNVALCATDARGSVLLSLGDVDAPVYLRSTAKPFIAAAVVASGAVQRFGLEQREVAVMAASHSGESFHVEAVRSILEKIGVDEGMLLCGAHAPYNVQAARDLERGGLGYSAVHNNCSGKHAGILALATVLGADYQTYVEPENLAQQVILNFCARIMDDDIRTWPLAIDGCSIPVFATTLRRSAQAFARVATLEQLSEDDAAALQTVREAMMAFPKYVSGTGEFDTVLMECGSGKIACKGGAEGVHGDALIERRAGLAVKVTDGGKRAVAPVVVGALEALGGLDAEMEERLTAFARPTLHNRAGLAVGEIAARRAILKQARKALAQ
ncbi:MAG: asparaginase [Candidatus Eremiobacteraeota bacterium]|nr:asparaginase [Candidatus Eremiobacteraeota bacterium]